MSRSSTPITNKNKVTKNATAQVRVVDGVAHVQIDPQSVAKYVRAGTDLVIHQTDGKVIRIRGFFGANDTQNLELVYDYNGQEYKMSAIPSTIPLDDATGDEVLFKRVEGHEGNGGLMGLAGLAGLAATGAAVAASSGGSGDDDGDSDDGSTSGNNGNGGNTGNKEALAPNAPSLSFKSNADGTVTASGKTIPGGQVRVTFPDGTSKVVTADKNGNYSAKSNNVQDSGEGSAVVTDSNGKSSPSTNANYVDDVKPNAAKILGGEDDKAPVVGSFKTKDHINDNRPELHGDGAEPNALVRIYNNGTLIGTTRADANGEWKWTPTSDLADKTYKITVTVVDKAGNESVKSNEFEFTIDTTAPDAVKIDKVYNDTNKNSLEDITAKGVTNDKTPKLEGSGAEVKGTVYIYAKDSDGNTKLLGTTLADENGKWSFTPPNDLKDDTYTFTANVIDKAGNEGKLSGEIVIKIDTKAPNAPSMDKYVDNTGTVKGDIANTHSTDERSPVLKGYGAEAKSVVTIYDTFNGKKTAIGTTIANDDGTWSFDCNAQTPKVILGEGKHTFTITSTDDAKNESTESSPFEVTVDLTPPSNKVTIDHALDDKEPKTGEVTNGEYTNDRTPTLEGGNAESNGIVRIYVKNANGNYDYVGETTADVNGKWSYTVPSLSGGDKDYIYQARATDEAGNEAVGSTDFTLKLDTNAPNSPSIIKLEKTDDSGVVLGVIGQNKPTNDTTPKITGTSEADAVINVYDVNGGWIGSTQADGTGNWSFTPGSAMGPGIHNLYVTATDKAGNVSQPSTRFPFEIDTQPPATPTISRIEDDNNNTVVDGGYTNDHTPMLYGRGDVGSTINIYVTKPGSTTKEFLGTATVDGDGYWKFQAPNYTQSGAYKFTATSKDAADNVSDPVDYNVNLDFDKPGAPSITEVRDAVPPQTGAIGNGDTTNDPAPLIKGTNAEPFGQVLIYIKGQTDPIGVVTADKDGKWNFRVPGLDDGNYEFYVRTVDKAGNVSDDSAVHKIIVSTSFPDAPEITGVYNDNNGEVLIGKNKYTQDDTPLLKGKAGPGETVNIYDGTTLLGQVKADSITGEWTLKLSALTPPKVLADNEAHTFIARVVDGGGQEGNPSQPWVINVDHTNPDKPTVIAGRDAVAPVVDEFGNGGVINDKSPVIRGDGAEPYSTVKIYDASGTEVGSVKADAGGQWKWQPGSPLVDGTYSYTAKVFDQAENASLASDPFTFQVKATNTQVPTIDKIVNDNGNTDVTIDNAKWTNDDTPTLHGSGAIPDGIVRIYDNGKLIGEVKANSNGEWTYTTDPLIGQNHTFTARTVDAANNASGESGSYGIKVDTVQPNQPTMDKYVDNTGTVTGNVNNGHSTDETQPILKGSGAEAGSTVTIYDTNASGIKTPLGTVIAKSDGTWEFNCKTENVTLAPGKHTFTITSKDAAQNESIESSPFEVTVDLTPPTNKVTIDHVLDNQEPKTGVVNNGDYTNDRTPTLEGSNAEPDGIVRIYVKNASNGYDYVGETTADGNGKWSYTVPSLSGGDKDYVYQARATDEAGNEATGGDVSADFTIKLDTAAPLKSGLSIDGFEKTDGTGTSLGAITNGTTNDTTPRLHGKAEANSTVTIYDGQNIIGTTDANGAGDWSFNVPDADALSDKKYNFQITATDKAGNVSEKSTPAVPLTIDTDAPNAPRINSIEDNVDYLVPGSVSTISNGSIPGNSGLTNDTTPTLRGGGAQPGQKMHIYDTTSSGTVIVTITANPDGSWEYTPSSPLQHGTTHKYQVTTFDAAENESGKSDPYQITIDTEPPAIPVMTEVYDDKVGANVPDTNATQDNTLRLSGTGEFGSTVYIYDSSTGTPVKIGEAKVKSDGKWSFTTDELGNGNHLFTVRAVDEAGNITSDTSLPVWHVTVDNTVPGVPTLDKYLDDVNNSAGVENISHRGITNDNQPVLEGTAPSDIKEVKIYVNDKYVATVAVTGGKWSYDFAANGEHLDEDINKIQVAGVNNNNFEGEKSAEYQVKVDTLPPTEFTIDSIYDDEPGEIGTILNSATGPTVKTNDQTPKFSGTGTYGDTIYLYDGTTFIGSSTVKSNGQWSIQITAPLANGLQTFNAYAVDEAGNKSVNPATFEIDIKKASLSLDLNDVIIHDNVDINAFDPKGKIEPTKDKGLTNDPEPLITGKAQPGETVSIYLNGKSQPVATVIADGNGDWSYQVGAGTTGWNMNAAGTEYSFTFKVSDDYGNSSAISNPYVITLDTTPPSIPKITGIEDHVAGGELGFIDKSGRLTNDALPEVRGTMSADTQHVLVYVDGVQQPGEATLNQGTNPPSWSYQISSPLSETEHTITVVGIDKAGNQTDLSSSGEFKFTVDVTPPADPVITQVYSDKTDSNVGSGSATQDNTLMLSGTGEKGSTVYIYDSASATPSTPIASVKVDDNGDWSYPTGVLSNTTHTFTVSAIDEAGNTNTGTPTPWSVIVDNSVPPKPVITGYEDDVNNAAMNIDHKGLTNDNAPVVSGTVGAGASKVYVYVGDTLMGEATINGTTWSYDFAANGQTIGTTNAVYEIYASSVNSNGFEGEKSKAYAVELDTTPPTFVTIDSAVDDEPGMTGPLASKDKTNDQTPLFKGQGEVGDTINLYDQNNNLIGSTTVLQSGTWSIQITTPLTNGQYTFKAYAVDKAGNVSVNPATFELDIYNAKAAKPAITEIHDNIGDGVLDPTGKIEQTKDNGLTNDPTPILNGTATPGAQVAIYLNNSTKPIAIVTAGVGGDWTYKVEKGAMGPGTNTFKTKVTDDYGNDSDFSDSYVITLDTTPPNSPKITGIYDNVLGIIGPIEESGKKTNDNAPLVQGTLKPGDGTEVVHVYINDVFAGTAKIDPSTNPPSWSYKIPGPLNDDQYKITTVGIDKAGNATDVNNSGSFTFTVDTTPPQHVTKITGAEDDDTSQPVTGPIMNGHTNDKTPILSGTTDYNTEVHIYYWDAIQNDWVDIGKAKSNALGDWTFTVPDQPFKLSDPNNTDPLPDGEAKFRVKAVDDAGNWTVPKDADDFILNIDTTPPTDVKIDKILDKVLGGRYNENVPSNGWTNDAKPTLKGTAEKGLKLSIYDENSPTPNVPVAVIDPVPANGAWEWTPTADLAQGEHKFIIKVEDQAGNETVSDPWVIKVDSVIPNPPQLISVTDNKDPKQGSITNGFTNDQQPVFTGKVEKGATMTVYIDGVKTNEQVIIDENGNFTWKPSTPLPEGSHNITFTATDQAGNTSGQGGYFSVTVDLTAPDKPEITSVYDNATPQTGNIDKDGGWTNDKKPVISGKSEIGATITIYDGTQIIATFTTSGTTWSWKPTNDLSEGEHKFQVTQTDKAGLVSDKSDVWTINVDVTSPVRPTITDVHDDKGYFTGSLNHLGGRTDTQEPIVSGTGGKKGETVIIYANGSEVGRTVLQDDSGIWSVKCNNVPKGGQALTAKIVDQAGNVSEPTQSSWNIVVDTDAPSLANGGDKGYFIAAKSPGGVYAKGQSITITQDDISVSAAPGGYLKGRVYVFDENGNELASTDVDSSGKFTLTIPPATDGIWHKYQFGFMDDVGNMSYLGGGAYPGYLDNANYILWSDDAAPKPLIKMINDMSDDSGGRRLTEDNFATHKSELTLYVVEKAGGSYKVFIDGVEVTGAYKYSSTPDGTTKLVLPAGSYAVGDHDVQVQYIAPNGTPSAMSDSWNFTYRDSAPPALSIDGVYDYQAGGIENGNVVGQTQITNDAKPVLKGSGADPYAFITIYNGTQVLGITTALKDGTWTFTPNNRVGVDGTIQFNVTQRDADYYTSVAGPQYIVTLDTKAPDKPVINLAVDHVGDVQGEIPSQNRVTDDKRPVISGSAEAGSTVVLYLTKPDGTTVPVGTVTLPAGQTTWPITPNAEMGEGKNIFTAKATDVAGNTSAASVNFEVTLDTIAPKDHKIEHAYNDKAEEIIGGLTNDTTPTFKGTAEAFSTITVYATLQGGGKVELGTVQTDQYGKWTFTVPDTKALGDGKYTITASATDSAGNVNHANDASFAIEIDHTPPSKPVASSFGLFSNGTANDQPETSVGWNNTTSDMTPVFKGTGFYDPVHGGDKVTIYDGDKILGIAYVQSDGKWSFTPEDRMEVREHTIKFTMTDKAGNVSQTSDEVKFTITEANAKSLLKSLPVDDQHNSHIPDDSNADQHQAKLDDAEHKPEASEQKYSLDNLLNTVYGYPDGDIKSHTPLSDNANENQLSAKTPQSDLNHENLFEASKGEINLDNLAAITGREAGKHSDGVDGEDSKTPEDLVKPLETAPKLEELNLNVLDLKLTNIDHSSTHDNALKNTDLEHMLHVQQSQMAG